MSILIQIAAFLSGEFKKFLSWIEGEESKLAPVLSMAETLTNGLKNFLSSPAGVTVESLIESIVPESTGLVDAVKLALPNWINNLGLASSEIGKSLDDQWKEALTKLQTLTPSEYAAQINSLKSLLSELLSDGTLTIQQALTLAQPTHSTENIIPQTE